MAKRIVKGYPSPRLVETIGATNQKPAEAIGELVANSFDARIGNNKVSITIDMRSNKIIVIDDGKGMTSEVLEKAVCIAEDMSKHIEKGEGTKGYFGMGFKTSCSTLGKFYEIYTRPVGSQFEYHVHFDIADYSRRPSGADAWDIEIEEETSFESSPIKEMPHGTAFVISKLKDDKITISAVLEHLGEAFKGHLETDDTISIIGNDGVVLKAIPKKHQFIPGTKVEINERFGPDDKYVIKGWVALDSQTHNDGLYGFNIYRNHQLVEKWDKSWFTPHLMTSRIIGEVNMDFLEATFYKQGTQQSESWALSARHMENFLKPIVSASRDISRKGNVNNPTETRRIVSQLKKNLGLDFEVNDVPSNYETNGNEEKLSSGSREKKGTINDQIKAVVKEQSLVLDDIGEIEITYLEKTSGDTILAPFDYIYSDSLNPEEEKSELQVIVYNDHPLWTKKIDSEVQKILATSDAIYRVLVEKIKSDTSDALKIRNEWIRQRTNGRGE